MTQVLQAISKYLDKQGIEHRTYPNAIHTRDGVVSIFHIHGNTIFIKTVIPAKETKIHLSNPQLFDKILQATKWCRPLNHEPNTKSNK
jgi:hypothetical protein